MGTGRTPTPQPERPEELDTGSVAPGEYQLVQMRLQRKTVARIEELRAALGAPNRTDALVRAVDIAEVIVAALRSGKSVVLESEAGEGVGTRERLVVPGLSRL